MASNELLKSNRRGKGIRYGSFKSTPYETPRRPSHRMTTKFAASRLLTIRSATIDAIVAILTVDVVGYSRLMGEDEAGDGQPH